MHIPETGRVIPQPFRRGETAKTVKQPTLGKTEKPSMSLSELQKELRRKKNELSGRSQTIKSKEENLKKQQSILQTQYAELEQTAPTLPEINQEQFTIGEANFNRNPLAAVCKKDNATVYYIDTLILKNEFEAKLEQHQSKIVALQDEMNSLKENIQEIESDIARHKRDQESTQNEIDKLEETIAQRQETITSKVASAKPTIAFPRDNRKQRADANEDLLAGRVAAMEKAQAELNAFYKDVNKRVSIICGIIITTLGLEDTKNHADHQLYKKQLYDMCSHFFFNKHISPEKFVAEYILETILVGILSSVVREKSVEKNPLIEYRASAGREFIPKVQEILANTPESISRFRENLLAVANNLRKSQVEQK